jgi:hypothetical protein
MQTFGAITEVIGSAVVSLVAAAVVHHAPALARLNAFNFGAVAAACARVAAAATVGFAVNNIWKSCGTDAGSEVRGPAVIWLTAVVASCCHVALALLHVDPSAGGGGDTSALALAPARLLLLQFLLCMLLCWLRPSRDWLCAALSSALLLAGAVSGCAAVYAAVAALMAAMFKLHSMSSDGGKAAAFGCGCHAWTLAIICWSVRRLPLCICVTVWSGTAQTTPRSFLR